MISYGFKKLLVPFAFSSILGANDPTVVPWPVGYSLDDMKKTKTLMNSYGDPNGSWADRQFHCGIDIDSHTASQAV